MIKKILSTTLFALVLFSGFGANAVQHDFNLPNNKGGEIWADLSQALHALATQNSGPTDPANPQVLTPIFTGTGVDDATSSGTFTASSKSIIGIEIDTNGTPDTFRWRKNSGAWTTGVAITGSAQTIVDGISVTFASTAGHVVGDKWFVIGLPGSTKPFQYWADTSTGILKQRSAGNNYWVPVRDLGSMTAPVITLLGNNPAEVDQNATYTDAGATASDNIEGDVTASIITSGLPLNTSTPGSFSVTYNVTDSDNNAATPVIRTVNVNAVCSPGSQTFNFTGADQDFTVPAGCNTLTVKAWGGGGGAGNISNGAYNIAGGGGYATADITVTPGEVLTVLVAGGGEAAVSGAIAQGGFGGGGNGNTNNANIQASGAGGGRSEVSRSGTALIIAGGGGGGNHTVTPGSGGGLNGIDAGNYVLAGCNGPGLGGTQTAPGAGGYDSWGNYGHGAGASGNGNTGGQGGHAGIAHAGGGGGGGYFGGGGGTGGRCGVAGGGGSSFVPAGGTTLAGSGNLPGNSAEAGGAGMGGGPNNTNNGASGKVVINWSN